MNKISAPAFRILGMLRASIVAALNREKVGAASRLETRNREDVLPPVSVYRWWARRTDAVNGAVIDAAASILGRKRPLIVLDPFAGGGVIPLSALRRGHMVYAQDLDAWAVKGLSAMLSLPSVAALSAARTALTTATAALAKRAYGTQLSSGEPAQITQTFRVLRSKCGACGHDHRLFPFALVSLRRRRDRGGGGAILACPEGHLFDGHETGTQNCPECKKAVDPRASYLPGRQVTCPACGVVESLEDRCTAQALSWEVVLVERSDGQRRELDRPWPEEVLQADGPQWRPRRKLGEIVSGPETRVLTRHGFKAWEDLYPRRQRVVTERLLQRCRSITGEPALREALSMAVLGTVEMAGLMSRWDRFYLKAFETMASHRFNLTTFTAEPNVLGHGRIGRGTMQLRLLSFERAARWMVDQDIGEAQACATVACGNSESIALGDGAVDLVLTDPPYHDDVQYADLSLPFRVWAGLATRRVGRSAVVGSTNSAAPKHERYRKILQGIFGELKRVLADDGRLVFSYANREPIAWITLFAALRAAGFHSIAYTILHSENELDPWRKKGRACSLDLLLELSPQPPHPLNRYRARAELGTPEESYLLAVGNAFLASATAPMGWEKSFISELRKHPFLADPSIPESPTTQIAAE